MFEQPATTTRSYADELRELAHSAGLRPFQVQVAQSPWHPVLDVRVLYQNVKDRIGVTVRGCGEDGAIRCLVVKAPPGYGKTHLLAWTRMGLRQRGSGLFVYVPPFQSATISLDRWVLEAAVDAIRSRCTVQTERFRAGVMRALVAAYDDVARTDPLHRNWVSWSIKRFWGGHYRPIGKAKAEEQLATVRRALLHTGKLGVAFRSWAESQPSYGDTPVDRDAFVALCLLAVGDDAERRLANGWLRGTEPFGADARAVGIREECRGPEKIARTLRTFQALSAGPVVVAFDQIEDSFDFCKTQPAGASSFNDFYTSLIRRLSAMEHFAVLFNCESAVWSQLSPVVSPMMLDRLLEDRGAEELPPLDATSSQHLVALRLQRGLWERAPEIERPTDQPLYPFTLAEVEAARRASGGELRAFLQEMNRRFQAWVDGKGPVPPPPPPPLQILRLSPPHGRRDESQLLTIHAAGLPAQVSVLFNETPPPTPPVADPKAGTVSVPTPLGLAGEVRLRIADVLEPTRLAEARMNFHSPSPLLPIERVDYAKIKTVREGIVPKLFQSKVTELLGLKEGYLSRLERGMVKTVPEDFLRALAELYRVDVAVFLKPARQPV